MDGNTIPSCEKSRDLIEMNRTDHNLHQYADYLPEKQYRVPEIPLQGRLVGCTTLKLTLSLKGFSEIVHDLWYSRQ